MLIIIIKVLLYHKEMGEFLCLCPCQRMKKRQQQQKKKEKKAQHHLLLSKIYLLLLLDVVRNIVLDLVKINQFTHPPLLMMIMIIQTKMKMMNIPASVTKPSSTSTTSYPSLLSRPSPKYDLGQGKNQPLQIRKEEVRSKHLLVPDQANEKLSSALWDQTHYTRGDEKNGAVNGKEEETTSSTATTTVLRGIGPPKGDEDVVMPYFQMEEKEEKEEEKKEVKMLNNEKSITVSLPSKEETTETMDDANNDAPPVRFEDIDLSVPPSVYSSSSSADQPKVDLVWDLMRYEAEREAEREPLLVSFLYSTILNHQSLESALAFHLANRIASPNMIGTQIQSLIREALDADPSFRREMRADILAVRDRDPVCTCLPDVFLYFKGFHALQTHRVAHYLWKSGRTVLSHFLQSQVSQHFQIDIHPNATMGSGIMLDHGTGIVIGETAVVGHNCSILHHVTLGGSGKKGVDLHPKVGNGVVGCRCKCFGKCEYWRWICSACI
mmetsp:Transcript_30739/g.46521  ORF Transcript_30739/g.46521 Transcript_30739/m.46521 type:complete len:495 (+) Transcript_30739:438-1922(+)